MKKLCLFVCFIAFAVNAYSIELSVDQSNSQSVKQNEKKELHFKKIYASDLNQITSYLHIQDFKQAQILLSKIQEKIFHDFQDQIRVCFPKIYESLKFIENSKISQGEFEKVDFGVVFTQKYRDDDGRSLEVNIVDAEQSAQDYRDLIETPNLIDGLENSSLIDYGTFKAIQTSDLNAKHFEQNILLSDTVVMTVVMIGISEEDYLKNFINQISIFDLKKLID